MTKLNFRRTRPLNGGHGPVMALACAVDETDAAVNLGRIKRRAARERKEATAIERENHIRALMGLPPKSFTL